MASLFGDHGESDPLSKAEVLVHGEDLSRELRCFGLLRSE